MAFVYLRQLDRQICSDNAISGLEKKKRRRAMSQCTPRSRQISPTIAEHAIHFSFPIQQWQAAKRQRLNEAGVKHALKHLTERARLHYDYAAADAFGNRTPDLTEEQIWRLACMF